MLEYFLKLNEIVDELSIVGNAINEEDFIIHVESGIDVGWDYDSMVVLITCRLSSISVNEAYSILLTQESRLFQSNFTKENNQIGYSANIVKFVGGFDKCISNLLF